MQQKFPSAKGFYMLIFLWIVVIFLLITPFLPVKNFEINAENWIPILIVYVVTVPIIWMLVDTRYVVTSDALFYCSGPIRGTIPIMSIRKIEYWNRWYTKSFLKPALSNDGLIIYYHKFDDIYISPKDKEAFIAALREINPDIEVV